MKFIDFLSIETGETVSIINDDITHACEVNTDISEIHTVDGKSFRVIGDIDDIGNRIGLDALGLIDYDTNKEILVYAQHVSSVTIHQCKTLVCLHGGFNISVYDSHKYVTSQAEQLRK